MRCIMKSYSLAAVLLMGLSISFTASGTTAIRWKEDDSFSINRGNIFYISADQVISQVKGLKHVEEIVIFKGSLVAREDNGTPGGLRLVGFIPALSDAKVPIS